MNKIVFALVLSLAALTAFAGGRKETKPVLVTIGATPVPHAAILKLIAPDLAAEGITVKAGNEKDSRILAVVKALKSQKVKDYILKNYPNGEVVPVF